MTVALRSPELVGALVPVDNAPADAILGGDFHNYLRGLREVEEACTTTQAEADRILQDYEKVRADGNRSMN